nr:polygalacturonase At1g48100 [Ipomoea batatas]
MEFQPLTLSSEDRARLSDQVVKACEEVGIFKVVNHGVSDKTVASMEMEALSFFSKPAAEKRRAGPATPFGYGCNAIGCNGDKGDLEYILLEANPGSISPTAHYSLNFRCVVRDYVDAVRNVACEVLEVAAEGLRVQDKRVFSRMLRDPQSDSCFQVGDGMTDDTQAFKEAWDAACQVESATLLVPSAYSFLIHSTIFTGPCQTGFVFQAVRFFMSCQHRRGRIRKRTVPQFNFRFDNCENVHIQSIHITAPPLSPNTDGIHNIENNNTTLKIYDSLISNGDDCVSIGSGCYDVDIRNLTCGPGGHGISIGSLGNHKSRACVSNITVRDSVIRQSDNGVRIKTWQGGWGAVLGVTFDNIHMDNVRNPIIIDQFYCLSSTCENTTSAVSISGVQYSGIKGTYDIRRPSHSISRAATPCPEHKYKRCPT